MDRREFGLRLALGATALPLAGGAGGAASATAADNAVNTEQIKKDAAKQAKGPTQADRLVDFVCEQYPHTNLNAETRAAIRNDIENQLRSSQTLSRFPLENSDEPAFVFSAYLDDNHD